jgi:hypothetical protein
LGSTPAVRSGVRERRKSAQPRRSRRLRGAAARHSTRRFILAPLNAVFPRDCSRSRDDGGAPGPTDCDKSGRCPVALHAARANAEIPSGSTRTPAPCRQKVFRTKRETWLSGPICRKPICTDVRVYLETLNPAQRRAIEHGVREKHAAPGAPLLVIAGAGSGKTNTPGTSHHPSDRQRCGSPPGSTDDLFAPRCSRNGDDVLDLIGVRLAIGYIRV